MTTAAAETLTNVRHLGRDRGVQEFIARTVRRDQSVGYLLSRQAYVLYGVDFRQTLSEVPLAEGGREAWLGALHQSGLALLAIGPVPLKHRDRQEPSWLLAPSSPFELVFGRRPYDEIVLLKPRSVFPHAPTGGDAPPHGPADGP